MEIEINASSSSKNIAENIQNDDLSQLNQIWNKDFTLFISNPSYITSSDIHVTLIDS